MPATTRDSGLILRPQRAGDPTPAHAVGQLTPSTQSHTVTTHFQRTLRCKPRIQLAQAACGGVARIDKRLFSRRPRARLSCFETLPGHIDFTAHLQHCGKALTAQAQRNRGNGAHVVGNILARRTIATRSRRAPTSRRDTRRLTAMPSSLGSQAYSSSSASLPVDPADAD